MPEDMDKYPEESDRRRFVKGVVGGAALAGVGAGGVATVNAMTAPAGAGGGLVEFVGIDMTDGPAPRGMPQIPIEIEDDGSIRGIWPDVEEVEEEGRTIQVARRDIGPFTYSTEWFQYCGLQGAPGLRPGEDQDNYFRYTEASAYDWQTEEVDGGDPVNINDFDDYQSWGNEVGDDGVGKPAEATWRSDGVGPADTLSVMIVRSEQIEERAQQGDEIGEWLQASTQDGFIAWLNVCTHFCCVPGYKQLGESVRFGAENKVYCQCHQSVYDPFEPVSDTFIALPRPEED